MDENQAGKAELPGQENPVRRLSAADLPGWLYQEDGGGKERPATYRVELAAGVGACSQRKAVGKMESHFDGPPIGMELGGDDVAFFFEVPEGQVDGILAVGAVLDGMTGGGGGNEAALLAARGIAGRLQREVMNYQGPGRQLNEIGEAGVKALAAANQTIMAEKQTRGTDFATTACLFALQEEGGGVILHSWNCGDSGLFYTVSTENGKTYLYPVTTPDDFVSYAENGRGSDVVEPLWSNETVQVTEPKPVGRRDFIGERKIYEEKENRLKKKHFVGEKPRLMNALGFSKTLMVRYQQVRLPQIGQEFGGGRVTEVKVVALTDGISRYLDDKRISAAFGAGSAQETNRQLISRGKAINSDDCGAVTAQLLTK